jgi:hypothetical protein
MKFDYCEKKKFKQKILTIEFTKSSNVVMQMGVVMDMVILEGKIGKWFEYNSQVRLLIFKIKSIFLIHLNKQIRIIYYKNYLQVAWLVVWFLIFLAT